MESYHLRRGQVYAPCGQPEDAVTRYMRIVRPGGKRVRIADAATGRREREVDVGRLHEFPTRNGVLRRTGYFLVETQEWLWYLTDRALRKYPYTVSSTSIGQDVSRGGYVRLEPQPALEAVRILVAALGTADWTVEPATTYPDELRVRFQGRNRCPSMYVMPSEGVSTARGGVATSTSTRTTGRCTSGKTMPCSRRRGGCPDRACPGLPRSLSEAEPFSLAEPDQRLSAGASGHEGAYWKREVIPMTSPPSSHCRAASLTVDVGDPEFPFRRSVDQCNRSASSGGEVGELSVVGRVGALLRWSLHVQRAMYLKRRHRHGSDS